MSIRKNWRGFLPQLTLTPIPVKAAHQKTTKNQRTKKNASKKARLHVALRFIIYFADLNEIHALQPQKTRRPRKTSRRRKIKRRPKTKRRRRTRKMKRITRKRMQRIWLSVQRRPGS